MEKETPDIPMTAAATYAEDPAAMRTAKTGARTIKKGYWSVRAPVLKKKPAKRLPQQAPAGVASISNFATIRCLCRSSVNDFGTGAKYLVLDDFMAPERGKQSDKTGLYVDKWKSLINHIRAAVSLPNTVSNTFIAENTFVTGNVTAVFRRSARGGGGIMPCGRCMGRMCVRHWRGYKKVACASCGRQLMHGDETGSWTPDWDHAAIEELLDTLDDGVAPHTSLVELGQKEFIDGTACVSNHVVFYECIGRDETKQLATDSFSDATAVLGPALAEHATGVPLLSEHPVFTRLSVTTKSTREYLTKK